MALNWKAEITLIHNSFEIMITEIERALLNIAILCVDDNSLILDSLTEQLKRHFKSQYMIEAAENGEAALEVIEDLQREQIEVALVIADQIMPGMNGDELLIQIHAHYPQTLTVMLTGQASAEAVGNAVNAGNLYRYLSKPWDEMDLILTVKEALKRYHDTHALAEKNEALQRLTASLEQKVTERTLELTQTNQRLQQEIQDRHDIEDQLKASLHEKDILLREIHHRVKNNLQIISSLLDFQTSTMTDQRILGILADSQNRIQSMALIHEHLYQSQSLAQVQFDQYINRLVKHLFFSFDEIMGHIEPIIQVEPILLNLETAIPCGLLINELVTNAFKHAFPNGESGEVKISLYQDQPGQFNLMISDNGIGLDSEIDLNHSSSLGLKLVKILSRQLNASVEYEVNQGTTFKIIFTHLKYKSRV